MQLPLYPLLLAPSLHKKVWGGRRLEAVLHKPLPDADPYGEAWELHDTAAVANGAFAGQTLSDLLARYGHALIGRANDPALGLPLLAKFIDTSTWVSVQVHPDDAQAQRLEQFPRGKTECWYIIAAAPDSQLVIGFDPAATRDQIAEAIRANTLEALLVYRAVKPGDVLFVAPGTVHAIGPNVLMYEIQQSCDITYRLYDWGHVGLDGKPRTLHIEKGLEVTRLGALPTLQSMDSSADTVVTLATCPYFVTELYQFAQGGAFTFEAQTGFDALSCIEGEAVVETDGAPVTMQTGQTVLVPASIPRFTLTGQARVLRSYQPET